MDCPLCKRKKCSVYWYYTLFNKDIQSTSKDILELYKGLKNDLTEQYETHAKLDRSRGDRNFMANILKNRIKTALQKIDPSIQVFEEKNIINKKYSDLLKSKRIDLFVEPKKIAIEIKTIIEFNSLGAAHLESYVCSGNYEKFYVIGLSTNPSNSHALEKFDSLISGLDNSAHLNLVVLNPNLQGFQKGILNLFDSVRN